ncbi:MAG: ABC transporter ATP-binding protein/permease, partial [Oscillospiraceae bacterium]|nr:ABC transporter ATP-binding protein/permease [Oscillospiraceae bacterium]
GAAGYVLENVSFTINRGETAAFIGSTGSGKSTLMSLLMRFYDISEGEILFRGTDIKQYKRKKYYNTIGYTPQKAVLFKGSVRSNVAYGDNGAGGYSDEDIRAAVRTAQSEDFVLGMEGGYDAAVSQSGSNLSGGQRQRLNIARAVCRQPEIFIFDDSFSALDYRTDRSLRNALKTDASGATNLIVAQRISSIIDADRIIVLEGGKVAGQGTHKELMKECGIYREIAKSQLSEEELAL